MNTKAQELGQRLRIKREEMQMSLKEVENALSIRIAQLEAIETGDFLLLIYPVYAEGFVKQYADLLELNGNELVKQYAEAFDVFEQKDRFGGIGDSDMRDASISSQSLWGQLPWMFVALFLFALTWYLADSWDLF